MSSNGFIKLNRSEITEEMIRDFPNCFMLLTQIAYRARREPSITLKVGQALIGDYKACGLTEQKYRTAKKWLEANGFITIKTTNKGTIATLLDSRIYDCNIESTNDQVNSKITNKQRTANEQVTTNKKEKKEKKEKKDIDVEEFEKFFDRYHELIKVKRTEKKPTFKYWKALSKEDREKAYNAIEDYSNTKPIQEHHFLGYARTFISSEKFKDDFKAFPKLNVLTTKEEKQKQAQQYTNNGLQQMKEMMK